MTDSKTATERLRELLDERNVEWKEYGYENHSWWEGVDGVGWHAENRHSANGLYVKIEAVLTPEQAVSATLGSGTCEYAIKDNMNESEGMGDVWIECSACHCAFDYYADEWLMNMHYCPNCGKAVKR